MFDFLLWDLLLWDDLLPVVLWIQLTFLCWGFPSSTFCMAGFVDRYHLNLVWTWNMVMVVESFPGYSSLR